MRKRIKSGLYDADFTRFCINFDGNKSKECIYANHFSLSQNYENEDNDHCALVFASRVSTGSRAVCAGNGQLGGRRYRP